MQRVWAEETAEATWGGRGRRLTTNLHLNHSKHLCAVKLSTDTKVDLTIVGGVFFSMHGCVDLGRYVCVFPNSKV